MKRKRSLKERSCALLLALLMPVVSMMPDLGMVALAEETTQAADPGIPGAPDAPEYTDVAFTVMDSMKTDMKLEDAVITIRTSDGTAAQAGAEAGQPGNYTVHLKKDEAYTYQVEKTGYVASSEEPLDLDAGSPVEVLLEMDEIQTDPAVLDLKVGESTGQISITNSFKEAESQYIWESQDSQIASVQEGIVTAVAKGQTEVSVAFNGKKTKVPVNVSKNDTAIGLKVDPTEGIDVEHVTCTVENLPADATGDITFTVDGTNEQTVPAAVDASVTYENLGLIGNHQFTAEYGGDNKYNKSCAESGALNYKKSLPLEYADGFDSVNKEVTYASNSGSERWNTPFDFIQPDSKDNRLVHYKITDDSDKDVVTISDDGMITPIGAGTVTIEASTEESVEYTGSNLSFTLTVLPKEVTTLDDIEWTDVSRVYDGTTEVTFQGVLKNTENTPGDHSVQLTVNMKDEKIGKSKEYSLENAILTLHEDTKNCTKAAVLDTDGFSQTVEITPRPLYLSCADARVDLSYGISLEEMNQKINELEGLVKLYNNDGVYGEGTGLAGTDTVEQEVLPHAVLNNSNQTLYAGGHQIIQPEIENGVTLDTRGNYVYQFVEEQSGTLNITQQQMTDEEILSCIEVDENQSSAIKTVRDKNGNPERIYIQGNSAGQLRLSIKENSKAKGYYDQIYLKTDEAEGFTNVAEQGITLSDTEDVRGIQAKIYLNNSKDTDGNTRTISGSASDQDNNFDIIWVDSEAPIAEFKGLGTAGNAGDLLKGITFGKFGNSVYSESVTISDDFGQEKGSGVKGYSYYIWKVENDDELGVSEIKSKAEMLSETDWTEEELADGEDTVEVSIPVASGSTKDEIENNYVVLLKTMDQVGNYRIYASNGIVVEQEKPIIQITMDSVKDCYAEDVGYTLTITDKDTYMSGISEVNVEVTCDGAQPVPGGLNDKGEIVDSYSYRVAENGSYTLKELKEGSELTLKGWISAQNNSNNIILTVTAKDRAGNSADTLTKEIKIDTVKPQILVSYDDEEIDNHPVNGKYYQNPRSMIVTYTERNFDINRATFDMHINDEEFKGLTIYEINDRLQGYGVNAAWYEEGQEIGDEKDLKDDRTNKITLTFSGVSEEGGADYSQIVPHCVDKAGLENEGFTYAENTVAADDFTIDTSAPEVSVSYKRVAADGKSKDITEQVENGKTYADGPVIAEVKITERYFAEGDAFKTAPDQDQMVFNVTAQNALEKIEDTNTQANVYSNWKQGEDGKDPYTHTFTIKYNVDAEYLFGFKYTDLSGRTTNYDGKEFVVDNIDPVQKVTYEVSGKDVTDLVESGNEEEGLCTNEEITVTAEITEKNFIKDDKFINDAGEFVQVQFNLSGTEVPSDQKMLKLNEYANTSENWNQIDGTDTYKLTFKINVDANYTFGFTYKDLSGRCVTYDDHTFTYDKTPPTGTIHIKGSIWEEFKQIITFGIFESEAVEARLTSDDYTSGVKSAKYYKYHPPVEARNDFDGLTKEELAGIDEKEWTEGLQVSMNPNEQTVIYEKIVDNAGNITYLNNQKGVIVDNVSADDPVITIEAKEPVYGIYNTSVPFHISVKDPAVGGTYSGLQSVSYEVRKNTLDGTVGKDGKAGELTQSGNYDAALKPKSSRVQTLDRDEAVKSDLNNSNDIVIYVRAVDNAGNVSEASKELKIDTTKPKISVQYDKNNPANTKYFQNSRTMTVTYTERNFDINQATFDLNINGEKYEALTIQQINQLPGKYGVRASWQEEGKAIGDERKLKDDRENHVVLTFTGNKGTGGCDYADITPHCTDKAGWTNTPVSYGDSKAPRTFSIDNLDPTADVKYYVDAEDVTKKAEAGELFANKEITAVVKITEKNFIEGRRFSADPKQIRFQLTGTEAPDGVMDVAAWAENYTNWDADSQTLEIRFHQDANYTFSFTYTDLSGRSVTYAPRNFTYDQTAPTGTVSILGSVWDSFLQTITFGFFEQQTVVADITSDDVTAGVESTSYYKYIPSEEERNQFSGLSWEQLDRLGEDAWTYGYQAVMNPNEQSVIYVRIIDRSGNVTYLNNHDGVIVDNVSPEAPDITITMTDPTYGIYNSNVPFHISVTDPTVNSSYAGLQSVYYEVRKDGAVTQSGNYDDSLAPKSARIKNLERDETVFAELNNSNNVLIYVRAVDNAGNMAEAEKELKIDITKPAIQVEYDLNTPLNERYYNATRTATVTVTERNFDPSAVRFEITNTDGVQPSISGWSSSSDAGVSDNAVNTCTVTFADDGDYTLTLNCTDLAGNDSEYTQVDEFTIDKTVPTISVSYDNNSAATAGYYNAPRTATVTVNEHNFNGAEVRAAITASLQGQGITAPSIGGWSQSGDTHTASISYTADGDYTFDIDYSDLAGNPAADYTPETFTIDQTKPEINIFDIIDKSANNGVVAPGVQYSDVNYTPEGVTISLQGANHGAVNLSGDRTNTGNGESIKMPDFEHTEEMDDLYTLTAKVQDKAGNVEEKSVMFSVNRFGSVYVFSDDTKELLDRYYTNKEQDLHVTEINVDTLEFNSISYGRDGELVTLKNGTDYTVKASGSEESWKQYQYTIHKENFEKEGNYTVTIDSRDRATNQINNKVKDKNIEFVIDKTKPTVVITGIENKAQYRADSRDITVAVSDNIALDGMEIYADGKEAPVKSYTANMIAKAKGQIPYTLNSATSFQEVKAVATDAAGNVAESEPMSVLVTSNIFVQFYSNKPVMFGSIGGVALIAAAIYMVLSKKKKNPSE